MHVCDIQCLWISSLDITVDVRYFQCLLSVHCYWLNALNQNSVCSTLAAPRSEFAKRVYCLGQFISLRSSLSDSARNWTGSAPSAAMMRFGLYFFSFFFFINMLNQFPLLSLNTSLLSKQNINCYLIDSNGFVLVAEDNTLVSLSHPHV